MHVSRRLGVVAGLLVWILASLACSLQGGQGSDANLEATGVALAVEQTLVAGDKATLAAAEVATQAVPPTSTTEPSTTPLPPTSEPPTDTPEPTQALPSPTVTLEPSPTAVDIEAQIKAANVLVYEDMAGYFDRTPLVRQAVREFGFSGGRVVEVNDALGTFKEQLLSSTKWDLILVAAEHRSAVQGEFWQYVYDQIQRGAAVVIEVWYLDEHYTDIAPIFRQCGIQYQKDWGRGPDYNFMDYAVYWLQPEHPFFQPPQDPVSLGNPNYLYWVPPLTNDAGDLLQLGSTGDAVLLAGTHSYATTFNGVLATCMDGTVIVQTFSTHDYKPGEVVTLWKNYMRWTLTNHFKQAAE